MKLELMNESHQSHIDEWSKNEKLMYYMDTEPKNPSLPIYPWIIKSSDNKPIGWAFLFNIDERNKKAEYGIAVPDHQPRICFQATVQILSFGFEKLGLNRIYIRPLKSNIKETNELREKFGFSREGIERQAVKRGDTYEDVVVLSFLREEFERRWLSCQHGRR